MFFNNGTGDCSWIIIILLLLCCCGSGSGSISPYGGCASNSCCPNCGNRCCD